MYETLIVQIDPRGVARVELNRPDSNNAFDAMMMRELTGAFAELDKASDVRVVVLTGAGKAFCAGGDFSWMQGMAEASRQQRIEGSRTVAEMIRSVASCGKPVVARVNGAAFGGGIGLAAAVDVTIAAQSARFAMSEVRLGLVPANVSPFIVRRVGEANARRFALSGRQFSSDEAAAIGLAHRVVPDEELDAAVEVEVQAFLQAAPEAIRLTKALISYVSRHGDEDNIRYTTECLADAWETDCGREGISSFLEKRPPSWRT